MTSPVDVVLVEHAADLGAEGQHVPLPGPATRTSGFPQSVRFPRLAYRVGRVREWLHDNPAPVRCRDCRQVVAGPRGLSEWYMTTDAVWAATGLGPDDGYLCVGCLSRRLGRPLRWSDLAPYPINHPDQCRDTPRLEALKRIAWHHRGGVG